MSNIGETNKLIGRGLDSIAVPLLLLLGSWLFFGISTIVIVFWIVVLWFLKKESA